MNGYEFIDKYVKRLESKAVKKYGENGKYPAIAGSLKSILGMVVDMVGNRNEEIAEILINRLNELNPEVEVENEPN